MKRRPEKARKIKLLVSLGIPPVGSYLRRSGGKNLSIERVITDVISVDDLSTVAINAGQRINRETAQYSEAFQPMSYTLALKNAGIFTVRGSK